MVKTCYNIKAQMSEVNYMAVSENPSSFPHLETQLNKNKQAL